jgi:hypothetical protein
VRGRSELAEGGGVLGFWRRNLDNIAAILLGIAALATAWSSYQASIWGGIQATQYDRATDMRALANHAADDAARYRMLDVALFAKWLEEYAEGKTRLSDAYRQHFRPEFQPAFKAWFDSDSTVRLSTTPFDMRAYRLQRSIESDSLHVAAERAQKTGQHANQVSDHYVFVTVLLATVLFFAGAVRPLVAHRTQGPILLIAMLFCAWAVARLIQAPVAR